MKYCVLVLAFLFLHSCQVENPNVNSEGNNVLNLEHIDPQTVNLALLDTMYVPIYSDIFSNTIHVKFDLTATLSIRNTSYTDTMYLQLIDYYNGNGELVRSYLEKPYLILKPLQSIEYVIEEKDNLGGTGANFMIHWGATTENITPVIQGVMISTHGQQGISFLTNGVSISTKK